MASPTPATPADNLVEPEVGNTEKAQHYQRTSVRSGDFKAANLLLDESFSSKEKVWILEQRIEDLRAELRASEENMTSEKPSGTSAEGLREAQRVLQTLQQVTPEAPPLSAARGQLDSVRDAAR